MEHTQQIIDAIPIRHNFVSYFISFGIFMGLLISSVILLRTSKKSKAFRVYGWSLLIQSIIATDVFLCYTGLIKYVLHFNDSTEPLVLLLAPSIYLFVYSLLIRKPITIKKHWFHFLPAVLYFFTQIQYYLEPISIKVNAYLGAYYPNAKRAVVPENSDYTYQLIKDEFRWLILFSFVFYIVLSIRLIIMNRAKTTTIIKEDTRINKFEFSKNASIGLLSFFLLIFIVYLNYDDDGGDHYIFIFHTIIVSFTSIALLSESRFFQSSWIADKYETSSFKGQEISIQEIKDYVEKKEFYLTNAASLKNLSKELNSSSNYISQIINTSTGLNFNDFINQYRVELSKKRLVDTEFNHLTIEAIGNSVGFNSKSAFYSAFKKHVEMSPKAFVTLQNKT
ncbi:helix-turn-helix domain-containing protein [Aquimarina litoralis]|uniref:helix-turn-helix domain-containing protein n=1 Tax=Aquimarina litoralis TaxID=584605 RepID=UPI001C56F03E|nr:helix-turn-helix domain-containing protein [Aquimarina litoralis]MBW1297047.1 helix-turn-helix domain-containing protein [Aquimarina litoralis]